jgi:hypothetical protein
MRVPSKCFKIDHTILAKVNNLFLRFCILIVTLLFGCSIGVKQVYYREMYKPPLIGIYQDVLQVSTENSIENSALLIYKIEVTINSDNKEIYLKGFQAAKKKYINKFQFKLDKDVIKNISVYKIFWVDPDNNKHEIKFTNAP